MDGSSSNPMIAQPSGLRSFGDRVSVTSPSGGELPQTMTCNVVSAQNVVLQKMSFSTSGSVQLYLKDGFGSLQVEQCGSKTCLEILTYVANVKNAGTGKIQVTNLDLTLDGVFVDWDISMSPIWPHRSIDSVGYKYELDVCEPGALRASTAVRAILTSSPSKACTDTDVLDVELIGGPHPAPTPRPTPLPTFPGINDDPCAIEVDLRCSTANNLDCETELQPVTNLRCADILPTETLSFRYWPKVCEADSNQQGNNALCETFGAFNPFTRANILCLQGNQVAKVEPSSVLMGDFFDISSQIGGVLSGSVSCVFVTSSGARMQAVTINTSGNLELNLRDSFGSMRVEGCGDKRCFETLSYVANLRNIGTTSAEVTELELAIGPTTETMLISSPIPPGASSTSAEVIRRLDICAPGFMFSRATVTAKALPVNSQINEQCQATDSLLIGSTPAPSSAPTLLTLCETEASIDLSCTNSRGVSCLMSKPPEDISCGTGLPLFNLLMSYQASNCLRSSNQQVGKSTCKDFRSRLPSSSAKISCFDTDRVFSLMDVQPSVVSQGSLFTIVKRSIGPLPTSITCEIWNTATQTVAQMITFDTSGNVELDLKDRYGAFQVEGCDSKICSESWTYDTSVMNDGAGVVQVNGLTLTLASEENPVDLFNTVDRLVPAGGSVSAASVTRIVDLCAEGDYSAVGRVAVSRYGEDALACDYTSPTLELRVEPPCNLNVSMTCKGDGRAAGSYEGKDCSTITAEPETRCRCSDCAHELRFRYTGDLCQANNRPGFTCRNVTSTLPRDGARILIRQGSANLYDRNVERGEDVILSVYGQDCLPNTFTVYVMAPATVVVTQVFDINTGCSSNGGIELLGAYGALTFSGYTCNSNREAHNCFVGVRHDVCVENEGTETRTLTDYSLDVKGDIFNLNSGTTRLTPGRAFCNNTVLTEIERCQENKFQATANAASGSQCSDTDSIIFDVVIGTRFPTPTPSRAPSGLPSTVPTSLVEEEDPTGPTPQNQNPSPPTPPSPTPPSPTPPSPTPPSPTQPTGPIPSIPIPILPTLPSPTPPTPGVPSTPTLCPPSGAARPVFAPPLPVECQESRQRHRRYERFEGIFKQDP